MIVATGPSGKDDPRHKTNPPDLPNAASLLPLRPDGRSGNVPVISKEAFVAFCATCGTQIADGATCPKCGAGAVHSTSMVAPAGAGLADNVAGALAYVTIIPAIVFLVVEPFNKKRFVRFHAFQSIFVFVAWIIIGIGLSFIGFIPFLWTIVRLAMFVILLVLALKAYQGQMFKLPVIGDLAEKQAGA